MSPLAVEQLTKQSGTQEIRDAIGKSVQTCIGEGKSQEECAAIAYSMAKERTGKALGREA